jgi:hypothetical protein
MMGKSGTFCGELISNRRITTYKNYYQFKQIKVMIVWYMSEGINTELNPFNKEYCYGKKKQTFSCNPQGRSEQAAIKSPVAG